MRRKPARTGVGMQVMSATQGMVFELHIDVTVGRAVIRIGAASGGFLHPSADSADAFTDHDPFHGAAGDVAERCFAVDLCPQFARTVAGVVVGVDAVQGPGDIVVPDRPGGGRTTFHGVIGAHCDAGGRVRRDPDDRLDPVMSTVVVDEVDDYLCR